MARFQGFWRMEGVHKQQHGMEMVSSTAMAEEQRGDKEQMMGHKRGHNKEHPGDQATMGKHRRAKDLEHYGVGHHTTTPAQTPQGTLGPKRMGNPDHPVQIL